ncbi:MAG TPA: hypothetical protein VFZ65_02420 [Planctomycetota bacterium]|nr:hypothetical protein [Planctomycetota bacterium]
MSPREPVVPTSVPNRTHNLAIAAAALLALTACHNNDDPPPEIGVAPDPIVGANDNLPGVVVTIESVNGASPGHAGVGERVSVDFTVKTDSGEPLEVATLTRGAIMISGPTFNYQRVIASQSDVLTASTKRALGAYTYTFAEPIPATYLPPLNDTDHFTAGELTGQPLLSGTYTVALELRKDYTVDGVTYRDPGNATMDFLIGDALSIEPREVVTLANCNQCHSQLRAHGDNRDKITNCVVCHTTGAEDRNNPDIANGTPDITIDFKVMIHKIHSGRHLPSVLGVTTNADGTRKYDATPKPYEIMGFNDQLVDFSEVAIPVWPSLLTPMPRDGGYTALNTPPTTEGARRQGLENEMRSAPVACAKCHGDPDGDGPLPAPAQGGLAYSQPSIAACGSCHDDWVPDHLYTSNSSTMPIQRDNAACKECHRVSGTSLDVMDAHLHPLLNPNLARGVVLDVQSVTDVGNGNGKFETGERVRVTMTIKDDSGADIPATSLSRLDAVISGPTTNPNLVHYVRVFPAGLGSGPTYTFNVPQNVYYESIGVSSAGNQTFTTARAPHWNVSGAATTLLLRTGLGAMTVLTGNATVTQNFIDVTPGTGASFAKDDFIVIEDAVPARREYMRVQWVQGDRLWFSSQYSPNYAANLLRAHAPNSTVHKVIVPVNAQGVAQPIATSKYMLDKTLGTIVETSEFGDGEVIASYTTDFVVPAYFPGALNDSPVLDQGWGDWTGLPLLPGTYKFGIYGARQFNVVVDGETTGYTEASTPKVTQLLFGSATEIETVARIDSSEGCYRCHNDIQFHGGSRRGFDTCLLCHGNAGSEDAANYVYPTGEPSPGVTIDFRTMLHKIHHGKDLTAGADYKVAGFGGGASSYEEVEFPVMPGGTKECVVCHGPNSEAWVQPAPRKHPDAFLPTRSWRAACGSCHDSDAATAHINVNTAIFGVFGAESCEVCHGVGKDLDVRTVHHTR